MGRPAASKQNKQFGVFFANVVTVPVESRNQTVARSGEGAIFYVFAQCFPELVRTHSRCGLTQLEFNKYLQNNDFPLIRKRIRRKVCSSPRQKLAFYPPSSFRFAGRRWRNPENPEDLAYLRAAWPVVTKGLNAIPFEGFCDFVRQAIVLDEERAELEASSDLSACSTPLTGVAGKHFDESDDEFEEDEEDEEEDVRQLHFEAKPVPSTVHPANLDHIEQLTGCESEMLECGKQGSQKRRVSEKWIDAQTFLEQCKAELPLSAGMNISEILALVGSRHSHGTLP